MNSSDFISADYLISQIVVMTGDENLRSGFNKGWYMDKIQEALSEIAFDHKFNEETCDFYDWNSSGKFYVKLPSGCFSVKEIHVWNGDKNSIESSCPVSYKRSFNNINHTEGYTAKIKDTDLGIPIDAEEIYPKVQTSNGLVYGSLYNGLLLLSKSAETWDNVRIIYYGVPYDIGEIPLIPIYLKTYIIDYVTEMFFRAAKVKNKSLRTDWQDSLMRLEGGGRMIGSKKTAERRVKEISKFEHDSLKEYWSRAQHIFG